jgi:polysaccharide export outer membrane protein
MFIRWLSGFCLALALGSAGFSHAWAQTPAPVQVAPEAAETGFEYRLGAGDKLRVIVFGEDTLGGEFVVSNNGDVQLPLIGKVKVLGRTIPEFQAEVETRLRDGYLNDPKVSAEILNYRPFFILGEVQKPGQYPYTAALTVMNAVATAEGFTYRADTRKVFIKHVNDPSEHRIVLTTATPVLPGDTIRIPERIF